MKRTHTHSLRKSHTKQNESLSKLAACVENESSKNVGKIIKANKDFRCFNCCVLQIKASYMVGDE